MTRLWEQARAKKVTSVSQLSLRLFDLADGFKLMGAINALSGAKKLARFDVAYETTDGGTMELQFSGPITDAQPVKDFLDPQIRAAKDKSFDIVFVVDFTEGLPLSGDAPEKLTDKLAKFTSGAAYVSATVKAGTDEKV